ncbi:MAG: TIGR02996 domain-containing protein [Zavarzinella sp.]|nr:TIGR02996 domain-containing protein [Zavarzinella sp.]
MSDADAFLEAIHAAPDDDAPRLVFADWLDEHGQSDRAEFIRVQIEMRRERERNERITPRLDELFLREKELFHRPWAETGRRVGARVLGAYTRGFPNWLALSAREFVAQGSDINAWTGPQTSVRLDECRGLLGEVARQPSLRYVRSLVISRQRADDTYTDEDVSGLLQSPYLSGLRELGLDGRGLSAEIGRAIASASSLSSLESLDLSATLLRSSGIAALAKAAHLKSLRRLVLRNTGMGRRAINALIASPYLIGLQLLDVNVNPLGPEDLTRLYERFGREVVRYTAPVLRADPRRTGGGRDAPH